MQHTDRCGITQKQHTEVFHWPKRFQATLQSSFPSPQLTETADLFSVPIILPFPLQMQMYSLYAYQSGFFHLAQYILDSTIWHMVISIFIFIAEQYSTV